MVNLNYKLRETEPPQDFMHHDHDFGIGAHAGDAHCIGIALPEFAVAPPLRTFSAEDGARCDNV